MTVEKVFVPVGRERGVSLYDIKQEIEDTMFSLYDHETGEIDEEAETRLETLKMDRTTKILNCIRFQKNMESNKNLYTAEIKRLKELETYFKKRADGMLDYLQDMTHKGADDGIGDIAGSLKFTKSTKTIIDDEVKLPNGFYDLIRKPISKDIKVALVLEDKEKKEAEEKGETFISKFQGAAHLQVGYSLKIK